MKNTGNTTHDRPPARHSANPQHVGMASGVFDSLSAIEQNSMQFRGMAIIVLEPKFHTWSFSEMWKVVREVLQEKLFNDLILRVKEEEWDIGVTIVHEKGTEGLHVKGPSIYRKDREVHYYLWIPTEVFQLSIPPDQYSDFISRQRIVKRLHKQIYLKHYFDGLVLLFKTKKFMGLKLDVPESKLRAIQAQIEEIIEREDNKESA